jgi:ubiquinone/menaquinone biosynthesis C-methylase UbiE
VSPEAVQTPQRPQLALPGRILHALFLAVSRTAPTLRPRLQRGVIRAWYSLFSWMMPNDGTDVTFLNYGYTPLEGAPRGAWLRPEDAKDEYSIALYERVTAPVDLAGRDVLEVGCGRGGGSSFIARHRKPRTMTGVDFAPRAVTFCRRRHQADNLKFLEGNAEDLPFPAASFDAVVNVESSHCYPSFDRFLQEVSRVLRPGGAFLFADLRPREQVAGMRQQLRDLFTIVEEERITPNVSKALTLYSDRRNAMIAERVPRILRRAVRNFAAVEGTVAFEALKQGDLEYLRFVLRKPA